MNGFSIIKERFSHHIMGLNLELMFDLYDCAITFHKNRYSFT